MENYSKVNYIQHMLGISRKFFSDERLSPWHISLYYSVFHIWNLAKFQNPVSISRSELMSASKIGSANTYTRCLKELDAWGYLKYNASYNPHLGSQVYMYTFDKGSNKSVDKGIDKGNSNSSDNAPVIAVIPYINSSNNTNKINKRKRTNSNSPLKNNSHEKSKKKIQSPTKAAISKKRKKVSAAAEIPSRSPEPVEGEDSGKKVPSRRAESRRSRPLLLEVQTFFREKDWPQIEAEKYYNHYQSNGWLVAGKTPMADWKASASKWMLNSSSFKKSIVTNGPTEKLKPDNLNILTNKNYNEPL